MSYAELFTIIVTSITVVVVLLVLVFWLRTRKKPKLDTFFIEQQSEKIEQLFNGSSTTEYAMALIEADKLLDQLLKRRHIPGTTLGERLKAGGYQFPELRDIWPAHKMRNKIVHEHNISLSKRQVQTYWRDYKKAYKAVSR